MNLAELLKEFLTNECGFSEWQVECCKKSTLDEVIVHLSGRQLSFVIADTVTDCCLISGSDMNNTHIMQCVFSTIDLREPDSFEKIWIKMNDFLPRNRDKTVQLINYTPINK